MTAERVKVLQPLSIKGKPVAVGEVIEVSSEEADEYEVHGWAERTKDKLTAATDPGAAAAGGPAAPTSEQTPPDKDDGKGGAKK